MISNYTSLFSKNRLLSAFLKKLKSIKSSINLSTSYVDEEKFNRIPIGVSGDFQSFEAALSFIGNTKNNNYQQDTVLLSTIERTRLIQKETTYGSNIDVKTMRILAAIEKILLDLNKKTFTVLDFGGALGIHYFRIKPFLPKNIQISWNVIELPRTAEVGRQEFSSDELDFYSSVLELTNKKIDLILASGSLHYTEDPYVSIRHLLKLVPYAFLIDRQPLTGESKDSIHIQRVPPDYYDASYPIHMLGESNFIDFFKNNNFSLEMRWCLSEELISVLGKNIPYYGLLFIKNIRN